MWLSRPEQSRLREQFDEQPRRELAVRLGLCGLRAEEIVRVARDDLRPLEASDGVKLRVEDAKRGDRETPVPPGLASDLRTVANARGLSQSEPVVDRTEKTVTRWIRGAAEELEAETGETGWQWVRPHDLRRTWATDTFYTLAANGNPIAEELTMGWGGWAMTESGRQTFRRNYLGPEPDHVAATAASTLYGE